MIDRTKRQEMGIKRNGVKGHVEGSAERPKQDGKQLRLCYA